ncbi:protein HtrL-like [Elysia marginata]|uniref:Protein HtrL-like n=1 Tax=Elysia marginata TaxID=1093978 RepID=A0AAV4FF16_9GAST|nr:protein HtrL-like [Elysia marginata]
MFLSEFKQTPSLLSGYLLLSLAAPLPFFRAPFLSPGNYSFTVVTGFVDIGRGSWWKQGRTYREYLTYLLKVLRLDVNLVVFIEEKGQNFVRINRRGRETRTIIHPISLQQLELFPLLPKIEQIMDTEEFQRNNTNFNKGNCEAIYPLYNLVTNSKTDLVHRVVRENPFNSSYFIWLDGGFGHGETEETGIFPRDGVWRPTHLLDVPGLYGGGADAMEVYHKLHIKVFMEYLERSMVDDDQTIFLEAFLRNKTNFRSIRGSCDNKPSEPLPTVYAQRFYALRARLGERSPKRRKSKMADGLTGLVSQPSAVKPTLPMEVITSYVIAVGAQGL